MILEPLTCAECRAPATHWLGGGQDSPELGAPTCRECGERALRRHAAAQRVTEAYRRAHNPGRLRWELEEGEA